VEVCGDTLWYHRVQVTERRGLATVERVAWVGCGMKGWNDSLTIVETMKEIREKKESKGA
jgi:hypothetical protein